MLMIRDILMYMDRVYVPHKGDCEPVYDVGLLLFRKNVARCPRIQAHLLKTLLEEIRKERMGEVISRANLKSATQMLVEARKKKTKKELRFLLLIHSLSSFFKGRPVFNCCLRGGL